VIKFLFLDRDGVLIRFPGKGKYVTRFSQLKLVPRAAEAVALLTRAGYELHIVSNQGCVSRGLLTRAKLDEMTRRMLRSLRASGGRIRKVHYCPHQSLDGCSCKKPGTKLYERALRGRRLDRRRMFVVGDSIEDILAGKRFGCRTVLVLSGRNKKRDVPSLPAKPDFVKKDLWETARWLTGS
jgi:D-glycero-D-manno-heptose 1,7-bisphosphate phosphatase